MSVQEKIVPMPHYILDARTATLHFPGIGRYVTGLAGALAPLLAADERLTVLYDPVHPLSLLHSERVGLIPVSASPFSLRQQWQLPRLLRHLDFEARLAGSQLPAFGVYHSSYYLMPYRPGLPTVLTVYDLIPLLFPEHSTARARLLFRWTTMLALRAAHIVIAISEATRRDILAHFRLSPERIVVIPLAADARDRGEGSGSRVELYADALAAQDVSRFIAPASRLSLPENYVLYLGSNKPHKNLARLVEAWHIVTASGFQSPDIRLVIAGAWDARYPEARARVDALGLSDRVLFLGPVADADLPALYAGARAFVFPSLYEGFGLPVLEAMACGAAVICSNASSLPEVAGEAALLVDPLDVEALAAAITRVLDDAGLAEDLRRRGLRQAARFSWSQTARRTLEIYRMLAH